MKMNSKPNSNTIKFSTIFAALLVTSILSVSTATATGVSSDDASTTIVGVGETNVPIMDYTISYGSDVAVQEGGTLDLSPSDPLVSFDDSDDVVTTDGDNSITTGSDNVWQETDIANAKVYNNNPQLVGGGSADTSSNIFDAQLDVSFDGGGSWTTVTLENIDDSSAGIGQRSQSTLGIESTTNSPSSGQIVVISSANYIIESVSGSTQTDTVKVIGETSKSASILKGITGSVDVKDDTSAGTQVNSVEVFGDQSVGSDGKLTMNIDDGTRGTLSLGITSSSDGSPNEGDLIGIGGSKAVLDEGYSAAQPSSIPVVGDPSTSFTGTDTISSTSFSGSGTDLGDVSGDQTTGSDNTLTLEAGTTFGSAISQGDILVIDSGADASSSAEDIVIATSSATTSDSTVEVAGASSITLDDGYNILQNPTVSVGTQIGNWDVDGDQTVSDGGADTSPLSAGDVVSIGGTYAVVDGSSTFGSGKTTLSILGQSGASVSDDDQVKTVSLGTTGSNPTIDLDDFDLESGSQIASALLDALPSDAASVSYNPTGYTNTQYKIDSSTSNVPQVADTQGTGNNIVDALNLDNNDGSRDGDGTNHLSTAVSDTPLIDNSLSDDSIAADHELSGSDDLKYYDQDTDSGNSGNTAWNSGEDLAKDADENGVYQNQFTAMSINNTASSPAWDSEISAIRLLRDNDGDGTYTSQADTVLDVNGTDTTSWVGDGASADVSAGSDLAEYTKDVAGTGGNKGLYYTDSDGDGAYDLSEDIYFDTDGSDTPAEGDSDLITVGNDTTDNTYGSITNFDASDNVYISKDVSSDSVYDYTDDSDSSNDEDIVIDHDDNGVYSDGADTEIKSASWDSTNIKWDFTGFTEDITQNTNYIVLMDVATGMTSDYKMKAETTSMTTAGTESLSVTNGNTQTINGAPKVTAAVSQDLDDNGKVDHYKITFDEAVDDSTFTGFDSGSVGSDASSVWTIGSKSTVKFDDTEGSGNDDVIYLEVPEGTYDTEVVLNVTNTNAALEDSDQGNKLVDTTSGEITEEDKAAPVVTEFEAEIGSRRATVKFSEPVDDGSGNALGTSHLTFTNGGTSQSLSGVSHKIGVEQATITLDAQVQSNDITTDTINLASSVEDTSNDQSADTATKTMADARVQISLVKGWNLVSIPRVPSASWNITGNAPNLTEVYTYDSGGWSAVTDARSLGAVFVKANEPQELSLNWTTSDQVAPPEKGLEVGWNLVGTNMNPSTETSVQANFFLNSVSESYSTLHSPGYNLNTWTVVSGGTPSDEDVLSYGGYWLFMEASDTLAGRTV